MDSTEYTEGKVMHDSWEKSYIPIQLQGGHEVKMADKDFTPKAPDYKGDGIAIWKGSDKNGKPYLRVSVLGGKAVNCFKYEPKEKKVTQQDI